MILFPALMWCNLAVLDITEAGLLIYLWKMSVKICFSSPRHPFECPQDFQWATTAYAVSNLLPNICFLSHRSIVAHICFFPCSMKQGQTDGLLKALSAHCGESLLLCFHGMCWLDKGRAIHGTAACYAISLSCRQRGSHEKESAW